MIYVVGIGPGKEGFITNKGKNIIKFSDVLIGGARNLASFPEFKGQKIEIGSNLEEILFYIQHEKTKNICIVASGDPLIYGIGKYLSTKLGKDKIQIIPGISSIQYLFSKVCMDMNDLYITSSHGKIPDFDYLLSHTKVAMLTDNKIGPKEIAIEIENRKLNKMMIVGENLSYENEKITISKPSEIIKRQKFDMSVVVIYDEG